METFGQEVKNKASFPTEKFKLLGILIAEEVENLELHLKIEISKRLLML